MNNGSFVISLDFELYWGVRDKRTLADCRQRMKNVWLAIPEILALFEKYEINATWAVVGFLFFRDAEELIENAPDSRPTYTDKSLCPYSYVESAGIDEPDLHFALPLIQEIASTKGQEIASHTLSHYYCLESGQTLEQFRSDMVKAFAVAEENGLTLKSLVFPRNQSQPECISIFKELGGLAYRGNELSPLYRASSTSGHNFAKRIGRLLDSYVNVSGSNTYTLDSCKENGFVNIPASRFLRPYSRRLSPFDGLKLKRIKDAMTHASEKNEIFHLWWHPHNFGSDISENIGFLDRVLSHYSLLKERNGMESMTMGEIAERVSV